MLIDGFLRGRTLSFRLLSLEFCGRESKVVSTFWLSALVATFFSSAFSGTTRVPVSTTLSEHVPVFILVVVSFHCLCEGQSEFGIILVVCFY